MTDNNESPPPQPKSHIQFVLEGGAGVQITTSLTPEEVYNELDTKGGASRTGYAVIPAIPKPGNKSEVFRLWRQKIIGFVVTGLGAPPSESRIFVPTLVPPDEIVKKLTT